jgi:hypothetical protein
MATPTEANVKAAIAAGDTKADAIAYRLGGTDQKESEGRTGLVQDVLRLLQSKAEVYVSSAGWTLRS